MTDLYVVSVDTRGKSSSDISGYEEHLCSKQFFSKSIVGHVDCIGVKSIIAELCGLNMTIYFHKSTLAKPDEKAASNSSISGPDLNRAAALLTMDPNTGCAQYNVRGIAYVVLADGQAPLSFRQVWGLQELANYAKDTYKSDPNNPDWGKRNLLRLCKEYRQKLWGPLSIYEYRSDLSDTVEPPSVINLRPNRERTNNENQQPHPLTASSGKDRNKIMSSDSSLTSNRSPPPQVVGDDDGFSEEVSCVDQLA
eukprot:CAMPEP_0198122028 /NCGR_PEP_ID=MMETSP1442-20131203/33737_1 /TAXON_ID= /ORGANISM="Craspedostauros australis, Strain CCMP3328" /LENGTH=251 /DNA_ID=CAMNT_0043780959 /DNA_START=93 /DNA_END=849 /DNA_ORIENTATION=+